MYRYSRRNERKATNLSQRVFERGIKEAINFCEHYGLAFYGFCQENHGKKIIEAKIGSNGPEKILALKFNHQKKVVIIETCFFCSHGLLYLACRKQTGRYFKKIGKIGYKMPYDEFTRRKFEEVVREFYFNMIKPNAEPHEPFTISLD